MIPGLLKQLRSYLHPVCIRRATSAVNPVLELYYYRGRWQLATADALYSDGEEYRPLLSAFKALSKELPHVNNVLVLGTGLGSAVHILHKQGYHPSFTLVELDSIVLQWALEFLPADSASRVKPVCADAGQFIEKDTHQYDLIIVDVFSGRHVPAFILSNEFLKYCRERLSATGTLVLNYMVNEPADETKAKAALEAAFGNVKELSFHINRVYLATA
jgi:spermidine synthase